MILVLWSLLRNFFERSVRWFKWRSLLAQTYLSPQEKAWCPTIQFRDFITGGEDGPVFLQRNPSNRSSEKSDGEQGDGDETGMHTPGYRHLPGKFLV